MKIKIRTPFKCPECKILHEYYFNTDELKNFPTHFLDDPDSKKRAYSVHSNNGCAALVVEIEW
jgi:phage FluMu protein Com